MLVVTNETEELVHQMTEALKEATRMQQESANAILKLKEENEFLMKIIVDNGLEYNF